jgi:hypothetical protein
MNHFLVDWIRSLVRENTGRQARDSLFNFGFVSIVNDIVVDQEIVMEELGFLAHVLEQSTNTSCQMKNVSWLMAFKNCLGLLKGSKVKRAWILVLGCRSFYLKSPSFDVRKIHVSFLRLANLGSFSFSITQRTAAPTNPEPPVTRIRFSPALKSLACTMVQGASTKEEESFLAYQLKYNHIGTIVLISLFVSLSFGFF